MTYCLGPEITNTQKEHIVNVTPRFIWRHDHCNVLWTKPPTEFDGDPNPRSWILCYNLLSRCHGLWPLIKYTYDILCQSDHEYTPMFIPKNIQHDGCFSFHSLWNSPTINKPNGVVVLWLRYGVVVCPWRIDRTTVQEDDRRLSIRTFNKFNQNSRGGRKCTKSKKTT